MKRLFVFFLVTVGIGIFLALALYDMKKAGVHPIVSIKNIDLYNWFLPYLEFTKRSITSGSLPLWTPYQAVGHPFLAMGGCLLFYPFTWVVAILEVPHAMLVIQFLNVTAGMIGTVMYLRHLKVDWPIVILGSSLFGFSILELTYSTGSGATVCWLPLILYLGHKLIENPSLGISAAMAAVLTLSFLGAQIQFFYYICTCLVLYFVSLLVVSRSLYGNRGILFRFGLIGLAVFLAIGFISFQLLPTWELSVESVRGASNQATDRITADSLPKIAASGLPRFLIDTLGFRFLLPFIPLAFAARKFRHAAVSSIIAPIFVTLLLVSEQVQRAPLANMFRFHIRAINMLQFFLLILSCIGLSSIWETAPFKLWDSRTRKMDWALFSIIISAGIVFYLVWSDVVSRTVKLSPEYVVALYPIISIIGIVILLRSSLSRSMKMWGVCLTIFATSVGVAYFWDIIRSASEVVICLACFMAIIILVSYPTDFSTRAKRSILSGLMIVILLLVIRERQVLAAVPATAMNIDIAQYALPNREAVEWTKENAGFYRVFLTFEQAKWRCNNLGSLFGISNIDSRSVFTLARWRNFVRFALDADSFDDATGKGLFYGEVGQKPFDKMLLHQPEMFGLASLRYAFVYDGLKEDMQSDETQDAWKLLEEFEDEASTLYLYESRYALSRAYIVNNYLVTHSEDDSLETIKKNISRLSELVVIENNVPSFAPYDFSSGSDHVRIEKYGTNEIILTAHAQTPSLVVLTDSFYPGWKAFVDGEEKPIWRANSLFRTVEVPPGKHEVIFQYRPASFILGLTISLATVFLTLVGLLTERFFSDRRKQRTVLEESLN